MNFKRFKKHSRALSSKIKRNTIYATLIGTVIGTYVLLIIKIQSLFLNKPEISLPIIGLSIVMAALGFTPLEKKIQNWTDTIFFRKRSDYHKTIQSISRSIASIVHLDSLYELLVTTISKEMRIDSVALFIKNDDDDYISTIYRGKGKQKFSSIPGTDPLIKELNQQKNIILRSELKKKLLGRKASLYIPLFIDDSLYGFLSIGNKLSAEAFYQEDIYLLDTLAHQAVIGIQKSYSFKRSEDKIEEMKTVSDVGRVISSSLDLQNILNTIIKSLIEVIGVDRGILFLYDEKTNTLQSKAGHGASPEEINNISLPVNETIFGKIFKEGKPVRQKSTRQTEHVLRLQVEEYIAVPMKAKDNIIGLIAIDNKLSGTSLSKINMELLVTLASQTAMAIENAKLYEETKNIKNYNENILRYMTSGIISFDKNGFIRTMNKQAEKVCGITLAELESKTITELCIHNSELKQTLDAPCQNVQIKIKGKDSEEKFITISTVPLKDRQNNQTGMLAVLTDMTEIKSLENQVRRSDRLSALGTMAAGLAHEIKNPLASMKLFVQLMSDSWQDPEFWNNYGSIIGSEVERLTQVVDDFLGFARSYELKEETVPANNVINKVHNLLKNEFLKNNVKFSINTPSVTPLVKLDEQRMSQVFMNLILNAVQAMPEDKKDRRIDVNIQETIDRVVFDIVDNGSGMSKDNVEKLFTPFFTTKKKGTGLGLSIVHRIVEEHGGKISVHSEEGNGTTFTITLPAVGQTADIIARIEDSTAATSELLTPHLTQTH